MIKLVAFDWNGTLLADTQICVIAANRVFESFGHKPLTIKQFRETTNVPISLFYAANGIPVEKVLENKERIASIFHSYYESLAINCRTRQNTKVVLKWLKKKNIDSVIFSNHVKERIEEQLERLKIQEYFSKVLANSHGWHSLQARNKQDFLKNYLKQKKLRPKDALIIGDGPEEIEIAREIGCLVIAISEGQCSTSRLKTTKPDYLISDLGNLISIIREINS